MKLDPAPWQTQPGMAELLAALDAAQGATRYVGGSVRDGLLGLPVSDVDLATRLAPQEVIDRLGGARIKAVPTGLAHGTITAVLKNGPVEVTTLRRDVSTDGRRATVAFTDDWREDAARRDFTINALSADPLTLQVHDYFDGETDLAARRLRFIGDPLTRIAEDHLRILRFFRFHARFGEGEPDAASLEACTARANDLMTLSRERIADELLKLLALPDSSPTLALMVARGILQPVLPEIDAAGVERIRQLVARETAAEAAPDPLRRLAALLPGDTAIAADVAARLRLSNKAAKRLVSAAGRGPDDSANPHALAYRIGANEAADRLLLIGADPVLVRSLRDWHKPRFPLGGGDLIAMGLKPGPQVARTLQAVERSWIDGGFSKDDGEVRRLARAAVDQALRDSQ
ncbi:CCA tRNA nucleotidyltransferase [Sphingosinicella sp. LY1275]|uniref:CCA tRNA nucleotidyltransferase n=1 Tax=Sphingosinicella sp. LY1275 TaxID=3095379 RepID=UPI002ADED894|nr:CCA tRNA nucleotidyltransferase [Sphingosinicella sp. LY1275]MEA1014911.1 CCA tRNA nucleotidyltransferase [Sphingosinicella sp. LY1275]